MRRAVKSAALHVARALGLFALARRLTAPAVRILCYHGTWRVRGGAAGTFRGDAMFMAPETFAARLAILRRRGYPVVTLDEAIAGLAGTARVPRNAVAITIDDGWYGTYADMLPALEDAAMPATLYCDTEQLLSGAPVPHVLARWIAPFARRPLPPAAASALAAALDRDRPRQSRMDAATAFAGAAEIDLAPFLDTRVFAYMTADELRDAACRGLDVQLHTHRHALRDLSPAVVSQEVADNRAALGDIVADGRERRHFCYPSGIASADAGETLRRLGLASATTTVQGLAWPGTNPFLLPRLLDGEQIPPIAFEAELSGFADLLRAARRLVGRAAGAT